MSIEEYDLVVTPEAEILKVKSMIRDGETVRLYRMEDGFESYTDLPYYELVKVNEPLRVRVDSEWQAEALVSLAEEHNWDAGQYVITPEIFTLFPDKMEVWTGDPSGINETDLTFTDDLKQIEAYIKHHGESGELPESLPEHKTHKDETDEQFKKRVKRSKSEDECDKCNDMGYWIEGSGINQEPVFCPDCPDESDNYEYSEPRPEDEGGRVLEDNETREMFYEGRPTEDIDNTSHELRNYIKDLEDSLFRTDLDYDQCLIRGMQKNEVISELEQELAEVREEWDELQEEVNEWNEWISGKGFVSQQWFDRVKNERDKLKERIEEARETLNSPRENFDGSNDTVRLSNKVRYVREEILSDDNEDGEV